MDKYAHGGDIYRNRDVNLDFSVNTNALGMPQTVKTALIDRVEEFSRYPDPEAEELREAIARAEHVSAKNVLCGNGAADLIYRMVYALKPKRAVLLAPTFSEYERALSVVDCAIHYHQMSRASGFNPTMKLSDLLTPATDLLFLCQPNNPTGRLLPPDVLEATLAKAKRLNIAVIVDECFLPFTEATSLATQLDAYENLVVLKAFTKIYALAGLRLGYLLTASEQLLTSVKTHAQCWSVSLPAQIAGVASLETANWLEETRRQTRVNRKLLSEALSALGLDVLPSDANYVLIESAVELYAPLLDKGILIRRCANFRGLNERFYRVAVKSEKENETLIEAIKEILHG